MKVSLILKRLFISIMILVVAVVLFGFWFMSLLPEQKDMASLEETRPEEIAYINQKVETKGRVLIVVTSVDEMGPERKYTGYELTELARPYYIFQTNGYEVDIASTKGGTPPAVIDDEDMGEFDFAFLNDPVAQQKVENSLLIDTVKAENYDAVFFAGGKGAMFDFPDSPGIKSFLRNMYANEKVIGAVCHGPAALVNVELPSGQQLIDGRSLAGFTNAEELFLIPEAETIFPFLLQSKLEQQGADFRPGATYLENVVVDGKLITGQNPWSTWKAAEHMIIALGNVPVKRMRTAEEGSVEVLLAYDSEGYSAAKSKLIELVSEKNQPVDRMLIAMHSLVAAMNFELGKTLAYLRLLQFSKGL